MADKGKTTWVTKVTRVAPNSLMIAGYLLDELIEHSNVLETAHLLITGELPSKDELAAHLVTASKAAQLPAPPVEMFEGEDVSRYLAKSFLMDEVLTAVPAKGDGAPANKMVFALGRVARYLAKFLGNEAALDAAAEGESFGNLLYRTVVGGSTIDAGKAQMLETIVVASVDHGVTPPSAQATMIAASVRATYEMSVVSGVGAITDVHGGAGAMAADFFLKIAAKAKADNLEIPDATTALVKEAVANKVRIKGLGHRVHSQDPRRDILWQRADSGGISGPCVAVSRVIGDIFAEMKGRNLPINVDGVIGAIVADMGLPTSLAKSLFVFGRVAGLSAHHFEEISTQRPMRRIDFGDHVYEGPEERKYPA